MCGILGWSGVEAPDMNKLKILGISNEERGVHSSGYFYNNTLNKGAKEYAQFRHLLQKYPLVSAEGANLFIGHTRHATYGEHTEENAHPFLIDDTLILAHNGTLSNPWSLCKKYGIDDKDIKVDSIALGHLYLKEGSKILEEYVGFATLAMHNINEKDALWLYHGASRRLPNDPEEKEERPLFYLKTSKGIYFSSLRYALQLIKEEGEMIEVFPHNKLTKIVKGEFSEEIIINRGDKNVEYPYVSKHVVVQGMAAQQKPSTTKVTTVVDKDNTDSKIWSESCPNRAWGDEDVVYFHKGRYWTTINSTTHTEIKIAEGCLTLSKQGKIDPSGNLFYFHKGIWIKDRRDYDKVTSSEFVEKNLKGMNFAAVMSRFSAYPITNLEDESIGILPEYRFIWYRNGKHEKSGFTPKFSNRTYTFKDGSLANVACDDMQELPLFIPKIVNKTPIVTPYKSKEDEETEKDTEECMNRVTKEYAFFKKKFSMTSDIILEISDLNKTVLERIIRDDAATAEDVELSSVEIGTRMDIMFDAAVVNDKTIEELIPVTTNLMTFLEDAVLEQFLLLKKIQETNDKNPKRKVSDDYVYDPVSHLYVSKVELLTKNIKEKCPKCGGLGSFSTRENGVITYEKCPYCLGSGEKTNNPQGQLFDDPELTYEDTKTSNQVFQEFYKKHIVKSDPKEDDTKKIVEILSDAILDIKDIQDSMKEIAKFDKSPIASEAGAILKLYTRTMLKRLASLGDKFNIDSLKLATNYILC